MPESPSQAEKAKKIITPNQQWISPQNNKSQETKDPNLDIPAKEVSVKLVSSEKDTECHFWVGLCKKGELHPHSLLDVEHIQEIFDQAAKSGINDDGPIMISDSRTQQPRFIYLLPPPGSQEHESQWISQLIKTINSWSPKHLGFYLSPDLISSQDSHTLLKNILQKMMVDASSQEYYLLLGSHNLNTMLNTALSIRMDLQEKSVALSVFH
ncbi:MAG: hypothetical protein HRU09_06630 [Oligoflexales bacterium]|nr:hypothetical protein [Oligoflexales bacterium]